MSYAIIGSGNIGTAVARQFARKAINVAIANARGPGSLGPLRMELGPHVVPQTLEAALKADVVILAVPFSAVPTVARVGDWANKIVIDATNAIDLPAYTPTDLGGRPSSELVAEKLRGARVVKAFNTLPAAVLAVEPSEGEDTGYFSSRGIMRRPTPKSRVWWRNWGLRRSRWVRSRKAGFCSSMVARW